MISLNFKLKNVRFLQGAITMRFIKTISASCLLLLSFIAVVSMSACSDVGHFDANKIAGIAKAYYNDKYGVHEEVSAVHQEITHDSLFGFRSSTGVYYCTMSDGRSVRYVESTSKCADNRQQAEITRAMGEKISESLSVFENGLDAAGYTWKWDGIEGNSTAERAYRIADNIAHRYFTTSEKDGTWYAVYDDDENVDFQAAYFAIRYDGDIDAFLSKEFNSDNYGYFPWATLYLDGADIPDTSVFTYSQPPKWKELAQAFCSTYASNFNSNGSIYFENAGIADLDYEYARLGSCSFSDKSVSWEMIEWQEASDGIWLTFTNEAKGSNLELIEIENAELEKYQQIGAISASEDLSGVQTMEVVAHDIKADKPVAEWVSVRIGYDPSKYEIRAVSRDSLTEFVEEMSQSNANNNNSNRTSTPPKPAYIRHADIGGGYALMDVTAYAAPESEKATILIVKKIG